MGVLMPRAKGLGIAHAASSGLTETTEENYRLSKLKPDTKPNLNLKLVTLVYLLTLAASLQTPSSARLHGCHLYQLLSPSINEMIRC